MKMTKQHMAAVVTGMVVATLVAGTAHARMHGKTDKGKDMHGKMEMKQDMPMMQGGMMGGMMHRRIVPLEDGGVLVVVGNLMIKYDKDLELVKKTTIEITEGDMQQMKKHRDMCRKMCRDKTEDEEAAKKDQ